MVLFRVDVRKGAKEALLGYDWVEVLAIEPRALAFRTQEYGDWIDKRFSNYYICLTPDGLMRILSEDFWVAIEEYGEYDERTPQEAKEGIVITTGDASVVQTGGVIKGGVRLAREKYSAQTVGAQGSASVGQVDQRREEIPPSLIEELRTLREAMVTEEMEPGDLVAVGGVAEAEIAASQGDMDGVKKGLLRGGKAALRTAREIGTEVAAAVITHSMGM